MPTTVEIPGIGEVDFPDSMNNEQIQNAIRTNILKTQPAAAVSPIIGTEQAGLPSIPKPALPVRLQSHAPIPDTGGPIGDLKDSWEAIKRVGSSLGEVPSKILRANPFTGYEMAAPGGLKPTYGEAAGQPLIDLSAALPSKEQAADLTTSEPVRMGIEAARSVGDLASGLTSPENIAILGATAGAGELALALKESAPIAAKAIQTGGRALSAYFATMMGKGALEALPRAKAAYDKGDLAGAAGEIVTAAASVAMAGAAGHHAVSGLTMPSRVEMARKLKVRLDPKPVDPPVVEPAQEAAPIPGPVPQEVQPEVHNDQAQQRPALPVQQDRIEETGRPIPDSAGIEAAPVDDRAAIEPPAPEENAVGQQEQVAESIEPLPGEREGVVQPEPVDTPRAVPALDPIPEPITDDGKESGPHGPIFRAYKHDSVGAIAKLREAQGGEAVAALHHPAVGDIDLIWGKPDHGRVQGSGLAKIEAKHPEVVEHLQDFLDGMEVENRSDNRVRLSGGPRRAVVRLEFDGKRKTWLLTAYEEGKAGTPPAERTTDVLGTREGGGTTTPPGGESDSSIAQRAVDGNGPSASPSYDRTRPKLLERVSPATSAAIETSLSDFEARNPDRRVVSFKDVQEEARQLGLDSVMDLDPRKLKAGETLNPAVRFAAREALPGLRDRIAELDQKLKDPPLDKEELAALTSERERLESDARNLVDVLVMTRSQDGRNLAYHRMMAGQSFDLPYWLSRAKRSMALPESVTVPNDVRADLEKLTRAGEQAEEKAIRKARKAKPEGDTPKPRKVLGFDVAPGGELMASLDSIEAKIKARIQQRYRDAGSTLSSGPTMPLEQLADYGALGAIKIAKGAVTFASWSSVMVSDFGETVMPHLDDIWAKAQVLHRDEIEPFSRPTSEEKQDRYKERTLQNIDDQMAGVVKEKTPSKWELTPDERASVDADPEVREARIALARRMQRLERTSVPDAILAYRRAGLLTGPKTHIRNMVGNAAFQAIEEVSRIPAVIVDAAMDLYTKQRTLEGPSPTAVLKASREAATRGVREAKEILKTGATQDQLAQMDMVKEVNTGSRAFDGAVNAVFRAMSAEDRIFKVYAFERSIQEQMKLAKVDEPTNAMRLQAVEDANFSTFNNDNVLSDAWSTAKARIGTKGTAGKAAAFGMDLAVPFARTPANILARVIDYTPVGAGVRSAVSINRAIQAKGWTGENQRALSLALGRGAVGTSLLYLGWWLGKQGMLTGSSEDDRGKRAVSEAAGRMYGSLRVGGKWRRVDLFSPVGNLLVLGATLQREQENGPEAIGATAAKTVMEQPMLQGVSDIAEAMRQPASKAKSLAGSVAGSFVPTALSDVGGLADDTRRDTRSETVAGAAIKGVMARVPGLRNTLPARRDVFGKPLPQSKLSAIDPTLGSEAKEINDPILREMVRVGVSMDFQKAKDGESGAQLQARQQRTGTAVRSAVGSVIRSVQYREANDEEKQNLIEREIKTIRARDSRITRARQAGAASRQRAAAR